MDGYIRIGTKIDEKGIDSGIKELEKKIDIAEQQKLVVETDMKNTEKQFDDINSYIDKTKAKMQELKSTFATVELNAEMTPEQSINRKNYEALLPSIQQAEKEQARINSQLQKQQIQYQKINNQISTYKDKITQIDLKNQEKQMKGLSTSIGGAVNKIGRWATALIGISSAYAGIRSMVSKVAQYNQQVSTDLQYMGFALAKTFEPFVEWIISALYKILGLVNQLFVALFGINIFKKSGVSAFQKSMDKSAKSAKEIKNSLASFDEMNILEDTTQKESGASAGGVGTPSFDLSQMQGEPPQWMQWIKENLPLITGLISGVVAAVIALKLGLGGIKALGIGIMIGSIVKGIQDLINYLNDPSWENFGNIITDIGGFLLGLGMVIHNIPLIVAGAIVIIVGLIVKNWEAIKGIFQKVRDFIDDIVKNITDWFIKNIDNIYDEWNFLGVGVVGIVVGLVATIGELFKGMFNIIESLLDGLFTGFKQIFDGIIMIAKGDFKNGFISIFKGIGNIVIGIMNAITSGINAVLYPLRALISAASKITGANWSIEQVSIPKIPLLSTGGILTKPTPIIAGEAGKEAVLPLENNTEWMDILINRMASKINGGNRPINIILDGRTIQRQLLKMQQDDDFVRNT